VWKTWQFVGLVENLDPDQAASFGQLELGQAAPMVERDCVQAFDVSWWISTAFSSAPIVNTKHAPKAWAERSILPRLTALEMPSMPMAK